MTLLIASGITFVLTALLTMAGVGAAFVLIPVFIALGVELHTAMATALLLNSIAMSIASWTFIRHRLVLWKLSLPIIVIASALSPVGVWVSTGLDRHTLLWLFTAFLVFAALMMLFYHPKQRETQYSNIVLLAIGGVVGGLAGFIGGLLGVGGGNIVVPALVALGIDPKKASASTAFIIIFASFTGFLGHMNLSAMHTDLLLSTGVASALGAALGAWMMSEKLKSPQVKLLIGLILLAIAGKMAWDLTV
jgi:uncharacterized membrane protein YfcA